MSWNRRLPQNFGFQSIWCFRFLDKGCSTCNSILLLLYIKGLSSGSVGCVALASKSDHPSSKPGTHMMAEEKTDSSEVVFWLHACVHVCRCTHNTPTNKC